MNRDAVIHALWVLMALWVMSLPGSCTQDKPPTVAPPKKVLLKIHCWEGYAREHEAHFIQYYKELTGADVKLAITSTTGHYSNIEAIEKNDAHLVSPANDLILPLYERGLIRPVLVGKLPHFNQINPIIVGTKCTTINGELYGVPFNFGAYLLAYNRDRVPTPDSYSILWDPRYRKRVTIPDVYDTINIYMTALMLGFPKEDLFRLNNAQLAAVEEKLRELNTRQVSVFWKENLEPDKRDQYDIGMDWGIGVLKINEQFGGNWAVTIPKEGATAWVDTWVITKNVTDPDTEHAAYAFIDFMISPESQARMAKITSYGPINPYSTRYLTAQEKRKYYLTDPKFFHEFILWQPLSEATLRRYHETWERSRAPD
ncbi:MAG TPA: extracellular solute-binding protein [Deltaproteobacteria bacterium]|nr:extracellular solute-binding protein [Deltaproteobacteria bacterium]